MNQPSEYVNSYHYATGKTLPLQPPLHGDKTADVCIIGAGMTGLNAAIELRKRGYEVVVLESGRIAWGASGRNGGMCLAGYCLGPNEVDETFGREWGKQLWDLSCESLDIVRERIAEFQIDCEFQQNYIELALKPGQVKELKAYQDILEQHYHYPGISWWDSDRIREVTTSDRYLGGLFDSNSAHMNPHSFTVGLAQAAMALGVSIFEGSKVTRLEPGSPNRIQTEGGLVKAKQVLLACNAYIDGLHKKAENKVLPIVSYIGITEPLGDRQPISNNMAMSDLNNSLDYFRPTADGRILFGGVNHPFNGEYPDTRERLRQRMLKVFPQLDDVKMEYHWGGLFSATREYMPHIEHLGHNIYTAHGYTGHGVSLTNIAGRVVAEAMAGMEERFDVFARIRHKWIPTPRILRTPALALAIWKAELQDTLGS